MIHHRKRPKAAIRPWTAEEIILLRGMVAKSVPIRKIGEFLFRSRESVKGKIDVLRHQSADQEPKIYYRERQTPAPKRNTMPAWVRYENADKTDVERWRG